METKIEKQMLEMKYQYLLEASLKVANNSPSVAHFLMYQSKQLLDISQVTGRSKMERFHCSKCCHLLLSKCHSCVRLYKVKRRKNKNPKKRNKGLWLVATCGRCQTRRKDRITSIVQPLQKNVRRTFPESERKSSCISVVPFEKKSLAESFLFETQ
ncbi:hypothetical protein Gasu2_18390 [Galdieria sulphuraria]|nr:hypothetical protein Gasu2_18390 [Galdieria sulphuraria]